MASEKLKHEHEQLPVGASLREEAHRVEDDVLSFHDRERISDATAYE